jgi:hypothetical protein
VLRDVIDRLGREVEQRWQRVDYRDQDFPQLAADCLLDARLTDRADPDAIVELALRGDVPAQCDPAARFGQPPVTLFRGPRFYIDANFWVDGTTAIHEHAFAGAFQLLQGASIETTFAFAPSREVDRHLRFGQLEVQGSTLRQRGDVQTIRAGSSFIHSLFHLARPSVSLVVRTYASTPIQLEYSPAGIAHDSFLQDERRDRAIQLVAMLRKIEHPGFEALVGDLVARADLGTACAVLRSCSQISDVGLLDRLISRMRDPDGAARFAAWLAHRRRIEFLIGRRAFVHEPRLRFLLALLLNVQRRRDALELVRSYEPSTDPPAAIAAWLADLSRLKVKLQIGEAPFAPNVLGLPEFHAAEQQTVAAWLSGERASTAEATAFVERLRGLPFLAPLFVD